jgi:hypothetical protein
MCEIYVNITNGVISVTHHEQYYIDIHGQSSDMLKSTVLLCGTKHTVRNTTVELFLNDVRNFQI